MDQTTRQLRTRPPRLLEEPVRLCVSSVPSEGEKVGNASASAYRVSVIAEYSQRRRLSQRWIRELVRGVLAAEDVSPRSRIEVLLAGDETVRQLNAIHLSEDAVTDVLSFPAINGAETEGFPAISGGWRDIGQIATSVPQADRQAFEQGHGLQDEVAHLIVHGVLHLLGFDHQKVVDEARMRQREETLLREIAGISVGGIHKTKAHKALAGAPAGP